MWLTELFQNFHKILFKILDISNDFEICFLMDPTPLV